MPLGTTCPTTSTSGWATALYYLEHCEKYASQRKAFKHLLQFFPSCNSYAKIETMNINSPWDASNITIPSANLHSFYPGVMRGKNIYDCMVAATTTIAAKQNEVSRRLLAMRRQAPQQTSE